MKLLVVAGLLVGAAAAHAQTPVDKSAHKSAFVTRDGVRVHYLDWGGSGKPVLLLHGLNSNAHVFDDFAPYFKDYFRVVGLTMRAHGESGTPDSVTVEDIVEDIHTLLDSLNIKAIHLVAHSLGGAIITRFAVKYPERVGRLVYLDSSVPYIEAADWRARYLTSKSSDALVNEHVAENSVAAEEQQKRVAVRAALVAEAASTPPDYTHVKTVALGIRARKTMKTNYFWLDKSDKSAVGRAKAHLDSLNANAEEGERRLKMEMNEREVTDMEGPHLLFITEPRKVAFPIRTFLLVRPDTDKGH